jgi:hypothetical protein
VIPLVHLAGTPGANRINEFGGDALAFAGMTVTIKFEASSITGFDDVRFSATRIPEPSPFLGISVAWLSAIARRSNRARSRTSPIR